MFFFLERKFLGLLFQQKNEINSGNICAYDEQLRVSLYASTTQHGLRLFHAVKIKSPPNHDFASNSVVISALFESFTYIVTIGDIRLGLGAHEKLFKMIAAGRVFQRTTASRWRRTTVWKGNELLLSEIEIQFHPASLLGIRIKMRQSDSNLQCAIANSLTDDLRGNQISAPKNWLSPRKLAVSPKNSSLPKN